MEYKKHKFVYQLKNDFCLGFLQLINEITQHDFIKALSINDFFITVKLI